MPESATTSGPAAPQAEQRLAAVLSLIAGMVDVTGFLSLGSLFTAHITGNLVVIAALVVRGGPVNLAQVLAIPVFILAVAGAWLLARASADRGRRQVRRFLLVQFLLLTTVLVFSVVTRPSAHPHGLTAGIAAMIAVCAMACQFALFRLALPGGPSTAVMTGNLTNTVLALLDKAAPPTPSAANDAGRTDTSLHLLVSFFAGCIAGGAAVSALGDWAWSLPTSLAALAIALQ